MCIRLTIEWLETSGKSELERTTKGFSEVLSEAGKMAQGVTALAAKSDDLSSIPGTLVVEGKNLTPERSCPLAFTCTPWHTCASLSLKHTCTHTRKCCMSGGGKVMRAVVLAALCLLQERRWVFIQLSYLSWEGLIQQRTILPQRPTVPPIGQLQNRLPVISTQQEEPCRRNLLRVILGQSRSNMA